MDSSSSAMSASNRSRGVGQFLRHYILPTSTDEYKGLKHKYDNEFRTTIGELEDDVATLQILYDEARTKRREALKRIKLQLPSGLLLDSISETEKPGMQPTRPSDLDALCDKAILDGYLSDVEMTKKLRTHLEDVSKDAEQFKFYVETQALAEYAHYRGLREWAQRIFPAMDYLATALLTLSTVGAGLVYSTIFGATRGNVGLMSFTFPLFTIGFLIPGVVQLSLRWASNLQREVPFASQAFWKAVIMVFMFFASMAVVAAITILNVTIFLLNPALPEDAGDETSNGIPGLPGIIAFAFSGTIFLLFFIGIGLSMVVRGPKEIMKLLLQSHGDTQNLEKYPFV